MGILSEETSWEIFPCNYVGANGTRINMSKKQSKKNNINIIKILTSKKVGCTSAKVQSSEQVINDTLQTVKTVFCNDLKTECPVLSVKELE